MWNREMSVFKKRASGIELFFVQVGRRSRIWVKPSQPILSIFPLYPFVHRPKHSLLARQS